MNKLAVFDLDSTLLDSESINAVLDKIISDSKEKGRLSNIQALGMAGDLSLQSSLEQRIAFFKGLELTKLHTFCQTIPWTTGALDTITALKQQGYLTLCLSGGFKTITRRVITELTMDAYCCNTLEVNSGVLTGRISGDLMHHDSKGAMLKLIQKELSITAENTLVVGDGANDLSMFAYAKSTVAFCAQDIVNAQASHIIQDKDLRHVLAYVNSLRKD